MTKAEKEELFEKWWGLFDKKVGKKAAKAKWAKVKEVDYPTLFKHTPDYVESTPEKQYRMHPATYLYGEHWEDEIIYKTPQKTEMDRDTISNLKKYD